MKVEILQSISSPSYSYAAGQVIETSKERGEEFMKHGIGKEVETTKAKPVKETATKKTAAKKTQKEE